MLAAAVGRVSGSDVQSLPAPLMSGDVHSPLERVYAMSTPLPIRPATMSFRLATLALAVSLLISVLPAHADDYDTCVKGCIGDGGSSSECHRVCEE